MTSQLATAIVDAVVSVTLILATRYLSPADTELVKSLVFALQPLALALIAAQSYAHKVEVRARTELHTQMLARSASPTTGDVDRAVRKVLGSKE